ncbi:MAG TPA: hypothetical protein VF193_06400 [Steroidobacter sp.]
MSPPSVPEDSSVCHASTLVLEGGRLSWFGPQDATWEIPLTALKLIGEYRTDGSPEGAFVAFVVDASGMWLRAPANAIGMNEVLSALERQLDARLELQLRSGAVARSRVLWPAALAGKELFAPSHEAKGKPHPELHEDVLMYLSKLPQ